MSNILPEPIGVVDSGNSSGIALGIAGVFTGDWFDVLEYNTVTVGVLTDQDSAVDGLQVQWSSDGITLTQENTYSILVGIGQSFSFTPSNRYFRIIYTNGAVAQTAFDLQSIARKGSFAAETAQNVDRNTNLDGSNGVIVNGVMYGRVDDDTVKPARLDASTEAAMIIDYAHHEIHGGSGWTLAEVLDFPAADVWDLQITTAVGAKYAHFTIGLSTDVELEWYLYESVNIITAGTAQTQRNHRRPTGDTGSILTLAGIFNTTVANANLDTDPAAATTLAHGKVGQGGFFTGGGGSTDTRIEWILAPGEDYCLRFISGSGGYVSFNLDWYEHTDRN